MEDVFPIENEDIPAIAMLVYQRVACDLSGGEKSTWPRYFSLARDFCIRAIVEHPSETGSWK